MSKEFGKMSVAEAMRVLNSQHIGFKEQCVKDAGDVVYHNQDELPVVVKGIPCVDRKTGKFSGIVIESAIMFPANNREDGVVVLIKKGITDEEYAKIEAKVREVHGDEVADRAIRDRDRKIAKKNKGR